MMVVVLVVVNNCTLDAYNNQNAFCFCIAKNKNSASVYTDALCNSIVLSMFSCSPGGADVQSLLRATSLIHGVRQAPSPNLHDNLALSWRR